MLNYYPSHPSIPRVNRLLKDLHFKSGGANGPLIQLEDDAEASRLNDVAALKARGKGKPKKAKTKGPYRSLSTSCSIILAFLFRGSNICFSLIQTKVED